MSEADREKWDAVYSGPGAGRAAPSLVLTALDALLPRTGRALDLAGGTGRHALALAGRGLEVTLADISGIALERARGSAAAAGLEIRTLQLDLELEPLPPGPWDLIVVVRYLQRKLFEEIPDVLAPGGTLLYVQPTRSNLQRHAKPSAAYLLEDGEMPSLVQGLEIVLCDEGWTEEGFHEARLVARKHPSSRP